MKREAILFLFGCSEVKSTWLITSEPASQRSRKEIPQKRESAIFLGQFRQGQICLNPETRCTTLFDRCVGPLTSPANHVQRMQETGPTVYKCSTFSWVILGPLSVWSEVQPSTYRTAVWRSTN